MRIITLSLLSMCMLVACAQSPEKQNSSSTSDQKSEYPVVKTEEEWKSELTEQEYYVIRQKGTERAGTGDLLDNKKEGVYTCGACGNELYSSETKFNSGTGWPSFYDCIEGAVKEDSDEGFGMVRTEILCAECGGHLGHVFDDGPEPTGLRHCVNSVSLDFKEKK
jgi:peptide-methionine (R)-S-oxide reductase